MKTRLVLAALLWASIVVGAMHLFGDLDDPIGAAAPLVIGGVVGTGALLAVRGVSLRIRRRRRMRSWVAAESVFPPGPRRVLLLETGLAGPE